MKISLSAFAPENLVSRDGEGSPLPRQPAHLHTRAESDAFLQDSSTVPRRRPFIYSETTYAIGSVLRRRPFIYSKPTYAIGSVQRVSGHAIAYRWRSLPRVRRHTASKPQGSFSKSASLAGHHGPINTRFSFPHPLLVRSGHVDSTGDIV